MYDVIKNVIASKRYELLELLNKIDTLWVQGSLTDDQRTELISMAQGNANVENSIDVMRKLEEMDKRLKAMEAIVFTSNPEVPGDGPAINYPEYEAGKWYYAGDTVVFGDTVYECIAPDSVVCVWSPADYPAYWQAVVVEELPEEPVEEETQEPTE